MINGCGTKNEALACSHADRGGRVEVTWDGEPSSSFYETPDDTESTRAWSLREFPENP